MLSLFVDPDSNFLRTTTLHIYQAGGVWDSGALSLKAVNALQLNERVAKLAMI